jgi:hypothetical protein
MTQKTINDGRYNQNFYLFYIYCIKCEENKYYVGVTIGIKQRIKKHFKGKGSKVTQRFKPIDYTFRQVGYYNWNNILILENAEVRYYQNKYGKNNVYGGKYNLKNN